MAVMSVPFAICIRGDADHDDLIVGTVYRVMRPKRNDRASDIRVVDESGEDYLYPRAWFVPVDVVRRLPAFRSDEEERQARKAK